MPTVRPFGQTSYSLLPARIKLGQKGDSRFTQIVTRFATEIIEIGRVVVRAFGTAVGVRLPKLNKVIATFTGSMTAGHIATTINVGGSTADGLTTTTVTQNFTSDLATTIADLATQIASVAGVKSASSAGDVLTISLKNDNAPTSFVIGGVSTSDTLAVTALASLDDEFHGAAIAAEALVYDGATGKVMYDPVTPGSLNNLSMNLMRQGSWGVHTETDINADDPVYVRCVNDVSDATLVAGQIRADSASGEAVLWAGARVVTAAAAGEVAVIEINLP